MDYDKEVKVKRNKKKDKIQDKKGRAYSQKHVRTVLGKQ